MFKRLILNKNYVVPFCDDLRLYGLNIAIQQELYFNHKQKEVTPHHSRTIRLRPLTTIPT